PESLRWVPAAGGLERHSLHRLSELRFTAQRERPPSPALRPAVFSSSGRGCWSRRRDQLCVTCKTFFRRDRHGFYCYLGPPSGRTLSPRLILDSRNAQSCSRTGQTSGLPFCDLSQCSLIDPVELRIIRNRKAGSSQDSQSWNEFAVHCSASP